MECSAKEMKGVEEIFAEAVKIVKQKRKEANAAIKHERERKKCVLL